MNPNKIPFNRITLATIIMNLATSSIVSIDSSITSYGQIMSSDQQDMLPMGVKITSPSNNEKVAIGDNTIFKVTGSSTDNSNANCNVSVILNNVKPYQEAVPTGPGGKGDYSVWNFVLTPGYNATIKEGQNQITSKLSCPNPNENASYNLVTHYSVFFAGVDSSSISKTSPSATTTTSTSVSQQEQQEAQQKLSPSIATLASPSQDNETIIQPADSTPSPSDDNSVINAKDEAATAAANDIAESSSTTTTPTTTTTAATTTPMTGTSTMTFTIYQEGRLEPSSEAEQDKTTTQTQSVGTTSSTPSLQEISCDQNLPISSFSAIGDDGDDALPQNAFDSDLDTRWSHDSMGSWIIVDVGTIRDICSVDIAWYRGDERSYDFIISLSDDGTNFKDLLEGTSRGDTLSSERYKITDSVSTEGGEETEAAVSARYVKITINGNNDSDAEENQWGALTEVDVNGRQSDNENIGTIAQTQINSVPSPITSEVSSATTESRDTMRMQISGSYEQNSKDNSPRLPSLDPNRLEGTIAFIDSTTNEKIAEYDLAPINITFTQAMKKITVKAGIDDPIKNGNVTSTLKFSSPIDVQKGGSYTSNLTATDPVTSTGSAGSNVLLAKISGEQPFLTRENTVGSIIIQSP